MFLGFDRVTLVLLLCLGAAIFQLVRWIRHRRSDDSDPWERMTYKQRIRALIESTPLGYQEIDLDGFIRRVNRRECTIRGIQASRLINKPCWELYPKLEWEKRQEEYFKKLASNGTLPVTRYKYQRPEGKVLTLETYETLLRDDRGHVLGMSVASLDITERQNNEDQVFQTTSELRALFQALPDLFLRLDVRGVVLDLKAGRSALPIPFSKDVLGKRIQDLLPQKAAHQVKDAISNVRRSHAMVVVEYEIPGPKGKEIYEARLLPLHWNEIIIVQRNITDRKRDQVRLEEYAEELEQKNQEMEQALVKATEATKLKSRFLANMSHEIRTPMNGVIGMTEFLLATPLESEQKEYAESLKSSANSLLTVIDDILDTSKIEAGKLQIESIPFDLAGTIEEVVSIFAVRARAKNLYFECEEPPKIDCMLKGDPGRMRQVLNNLVCNAIKFTDSGGVTLRTTVMAQTPETLTLRFAVDDTGIGIPPDQRKHLFQYFAQGDDSTTRKYGGTGLGLAISKQLVELMGGEIGVNSEPDRGSCFWFTAVFSKLAVEQHLETNSTISLDGLRVLVVDRKNSAAILSKHYLPAWGCDSEITEHGQQVAPMLCEAMGNGKPFQLALIDLELADLDGIDPEQHIRTDPNIRSTRLVAMTSVPRRGDGLSVHQKGYDGYIVKPILPAELHSLIAAVLTRDPNSDAPLVTRHTVLEQQHKSTKSGNKQYNHPAEKLQQKPASYEHQSPSQKGSLVKPSPIQQHDPGHRKKPRALVAEDNIVNQKIALRLLQKAGLNVDVVSNGREAVAASLRTAYDLILMDCQMPEMDGFEATAEIRRREGTSQHTPICALTAHAMKSDREKCLASGMDEYLSKPVNLEKLQHTVNLLLHKQPSDDGDLESEAGGKRDSKTMASGT